MSTFPSGSSPDAPGAPQRPSRVPLVSTGVPHLDVLLGGGIAQGALVIMLGQPGSGKTTLAGQIAFAQARAGHTVLLLTALAESTTKLPEHLSSYRFFAPDLLGNAIQIFSLQQFLTRGEPPTAEEIMALVRQTQARIVIIDGFQSLRGVGLDQQVSRQLLYHIGTGLGVYGVTTLVTTESDPRDPTMFPEMTTCDVLIGLYFRQRGVRAIRSLEVIKARGRAPLLGHHGISLSDEGVQIFPRLESQFRQSAPELWRVDVTGLALPEPVPFGLPALDQALGGGLTRRTSTLLAGSLGTGKTLLALQFALAGIDRGEPAVFLNFRESNEQLVQKAAAFAFARQLHAALASGKLVLQHWEPIELDPDQIAIHLLDAIEQTRAHRVVIDNIAEFERAIKESGQPERVPNYLAALLASLRMHDVTALTIKEISKGIATSLDFSVDDLSIMAENVLVIQQLVSRQQLHRVLSVLKMRFSPHDYALRTLRITAPEGICVLTPQESTQAGLGEITAQQGKIQANSTTPFQGER